MKRDMDLVRQLLLTIERDGTPELQDVPIVEGHDARLVVYHVRLLKEAGLANAMDVSTLDGEEYIQIAMTWQGHEFLETVRDPEIWRKTKTGAAKVGSFSIALIADLAKATITAKAASLGLI